MVGRKRPSKSAWLAAATLSVGAHLVAFILLASNSGAFRSTAQMPVDVQIIPFAPDRKPPPPPARRPVGARTKDRTASTALPVTEQLITQPTVTENQPGPVSPISPGDFTALARPVLPGAADCNSRGLVPRERQDCDRRQMASAADRRADPRKQFESLNPGGFAPGDGTPYLVRQPKNGCKPVAGLRSSASDDGIAAGIGCAFDF
jgi:hypothetical protein